MMASKQSLANKLLWETMAANFSRPVEQQEEADWSALTAEPEDVDYTKADADGVPALWIVPTGSAPDRVIFYSHGGGFVSGSIDTHRKMVGHLAKAAGCRALIFDYPYADQAQYPVQLKTTETAYRWLLDQGVEPRNVAVAGDSCGAILTFGLLQRLRDQGLPQPAAAMIISGWLDMALTGESYRTNREKDLLFAREFCDGLVKNFLGDGDRRDPYVSALYADMRGFPPIFLQAGADETLVDESRMFAERARQQGVEVRLDIFAEMLHSFQMMAGRAPEADDAIARFAEWVRPRLGIAGAGQNAA
jgi:epsilon-lactone hydrolase